MKKIISASFLFLFLCACNENKVSEQEPEDQKTDLNAATDFIRYALDGNYDKARKMVVPDSVNRQTIDLFEWDYRNKRSPEEKRSYRESSIHILQSRHLNDSVTILTYSNSFRNTPDSLKVVRINGQWLIDMSYRFQPKDTTRK
ncbi:MAG: hypothetical protein GC171_12700 [Terrimonas sp.]|nr:hypothetical protein [Terrimonas sp.]